MTIRQPFHAAPQGALRSLTSCVLLRTLLIIVACLAASRLEAAEPPKSVGQTVHWAFRSPIRPPVPKIQNPKSKIQNPIDAFLLAALARKGLTYSPEADRRVLIRRVTYDLIGLPPTPKEVDDFLA